jgi:ribonuclease P protein subunit RPR2
MGKKTRQEDVPNPGSVANRDVLQRMNFLYQASAYLQSVSTASTSSSVSTISSVSKSRVPGALQKGNKKSGLNAKGRKAERHAARLKRVIGVEDLARSYVRTMKQIGLKATVKMCVHIPNTKASPYYTAVSALMLFFSLGIHL